MTARATLPDLNSLTKDSLKALILAQHETLTAQEEALHSKEELLASRDAEIERLKLLIAKLRRMQFGRKSEKLERQIEQLELQLDELEAARAERAASSPRPEAAAHADNGRPARRPLPAHLPREVREIRPKETACPDCRGTLKHLGEDVSEVLEYVPAEFRVIRQVRPKLGSSRVGDHNANGPSYPRGQDFGEEQGTCGQGFSALKRFKRRQRNCTS